MSASEGKADMQFRLTRFHICPSTDMTQSQVVSLGPVENANLLRCMCA